MIKKDIRKVIHGIRGRVFKRRYPFSRIVMYQAIEQRMCAFNTGGLILEVGASRAYPQKLQWFTENSCYFFANIDPTESPDIVTDGNALGFAPNVFDGVVLDQVLEHVPNPSQVLSESYRVLKPEGVIIVAVPFMMQIHPIPDDYWRFSESGLMVLLKQAGFRDVTTDSWGHQQAVIAHMYYSWHGVRTRWGQRRLLERVSDKRFPLHCWAIANK